MSGGGWVVVGLFLLVLVLIALGEEKPWRDD